MDGRCCATCRVGASSSTRSTLTSPNTGSSAITFFLSCTEVMGLLVKGCNVGIHQKQLRLLRECLALILGRGVPVPALWYRHLLVWTGAGMLGLLLHSMQVSLTAHSRRQAKLGVLRLGEV